MSSNVARHPLDLPPAPLTAPVVRRLLGWSQVQVAALAETSVGTVRLFEIAPAAISPATRRRLEEAYALMRTLFLSS
jgi:hypothetical protein